MKRFILMLQFLTKYPLPFELQVEREDFTKGAVWFPMVGFVIGMTLYGLFLLTRTVDVLLARIAIVVAGEIFITGGLHLDGLADAFDGLYSYRNKERMLEIMKDSRVGTNGVLILIVDILLKVVLLSAIPVTALPWVMVLMPVYGRFNGILLAAISKYARPEGMGGFFIGKIKAVQMLFIILTTLVVGLLHISALLYLPVLILLTLLYRYHVQAKLGGVTGDIIGAWIELSELAFLLMVVII